MPTSLSALRQRLLAGGVIPASPLALTPEREFDARHQRALFRYYAAAGAAGIAVGVHTTQFAIHEPEVGLYQPLLELAAEIIATSDNPGLIKVAGLVGNTAQATREAEQAASLGFQCGLLSLAAFSGKTINEIIAHCKAVAEVIPLFGFYLQPAVGGRVLPYAFWRQFAEIERVVAIKIAPFDRYRTLDVVRAVADSGRSHEIALYTGNDDHIVGDLLTEFRFSKDTDAPTLRIVGGLLGHWAVWTKKAVELWHQCQHAVAEGHISSDLFTLGAQITDSNAAFFDVAHDFEGCIAGLHQVLAHQGLLAGRQCLDPQEDLSVGQAAEIERVYRAYPHLNDDDFVAEHLDTWLA